MVKNPSLPGMNLANGLEHKRPIFFYKFTVLIAIVTWRLQKKSTRNDNHPWVLNTCLCFFTTSKLYQEMLVKEKISLNKIVNCKSKA